MKTLAAPDSHELYEACVQQPARLVPWLLAMHGGRATVLGEDFCGTAALSRAWLRDVPHGRAIAVDHDPEVLARAGSDLRLEKRLGDVRSTSDARRHALDVLFVGNFSIGELGTRVELVRYLARSRSRLRPGGIFVCDTYGGASAFRTGSVERIHAMPDGRRVRYVWEQRSADPRDGRVVNALHFRVEEDGVVTHELHDAFVYRWRLWTLAELREALLEAGFREVEVWTELGAQHPVASPAELGESWIACLCAR